VTATPREPDDEKLRLLVAEAARGLFLIRHPMSRRIVWIIVNLIMICGILLMIVLSFPPIADTIASAYKNVTCPLFSKQWMEWTEMTAEILAVAFLGGAIFSEHWYSMVRDRVNNLITSESSRLDDIEARKQKELADAIVTLNKILNKTEVLSFRDAVAKSYDAISTIISILRFSMLRYPRIAILNLLFATFPGGVLGLASFISFAVFFGMKVAIFIGKSPACQ
jgi:hypothetical protein